MTLVGADLNEKLQFYFGKTLAYYLEVTVVLMLDTCCNSLDLLKCLLLIG